jgi:small subunit ribosomal protein S7
MRGKAATRRAVTPDPKFGNENIARFTNLVMHDGKKSTAMRVMYDCFDIISEKTKQNPVEVFENALKNVMPTLEVKSKRVGGANYQVPMPVRGERRFMLAARWILIATRAKKGRPMAVKLSDELIAASKNEGDAVKKKADVQRMAEANRAFAHFAR